MKDIDFLPEWYKSGIRREVSYRTQYFALGGIFLVMVVWSLTTSHSISKARAEFSDMAAMESQAQSVSRDLAGLENQLSSLRKKTKSIEEIDSRIDVTAVLGELSFLIKRNIVLNKVEFIAEKFKNEQKNKDSKLTGAVVRAVRVRNQQKQKLPLGNVRFKVVIAGVAANGRAVADLTRELEESTYFFQVKPSFSRSTELQIDNTASADSATDATRRTTEMRNTTSGQSKSLEASEFEIICYLANYRKL
jgi:hypothetical protein